MQQHIVYQSSDQAICVTPTKISINGTTYETSNIRSVATRKIKTTVLGKASVFGLILLSGLFYWILSSFLGVSMGWAIGVALAGAGSAIAGLRRKEVLVVTVVTSHGQETIFKSVVDEAVTLALVQAIEEVIASAAVNASLQGESAECPYCGKVIEQKAMVCRFCGQEMR